MKSKLFPAVMLALVVSVALVFGQADQVKTRAKDLKKKIETQQTNQVEKPTPPEPKK